MRRRFGPADPANHCALNVALYRPGRHDWAMTERPRARLVRSADRLDIGPSRVSAARDGLTIDINEYAAPVPRRIRGRVRVHLPAVSRQVFSLDAPGRHRWWPICPCATIEVDLVSPRLRWSGLAYVDMNAGDEPLEAGFRHWHWSRAGLRDGAAILYDVVRRNGEAGSIALRFDRAGGVEEFAGPAPAPLSTTVWGLPRATRSDSGTATVRRTFESAPFYARSLVAAELCGEPVTAIHESLSLDRFRAPWVQALLPFKMPRIER